jgi:hypothetical protein
MKFCCRKSKAWPGISNPRKVEANSNPLTAQTFEYFCLDALVL